MNDIHPLSPGKRLLLVEDDRDNLDTLSILLETRYQVFPYLSAAEAVAAIDVAEPDLLVLDIGMRPIDGLECLRAIRAMPRHRETPALALTGYAQELTVDVFHDVWRRAPTYDPSGGTVLGWIMNQARSRAIDRLRFEQRKKRSPRQDADAPAAPAAGCPGDLLGDRDRGNTVRRAVEALTPAEREAIESAFFGGLTHREVAARLNQPLGTVKTRIRSGLAKLRRMLEGEER